jgi:putative oxidoreductase
MSTPIASHVPSFEKSGPLPAWQPLIRTSDESASAYLRVVLGAVMFPHAAQKAFGWFGGGGVSGTLAFFRNGLHVPNAVGLLVIVLELAAAVALVVGAFTRVAAAAIGAVMVAAVAMVHLPHGFFMNWFGNQAGEGFEYHLLVLAMVAALVLRGGGRGSVDRWLTPGARAGRKMPWR